MGEPLDHFAEHGTRDRNEDAQPAAERQRDLSAPEDTVTDNLADATDAEIVDTTTDAPEPDGSGESDE